MKQEIYNKLVEYSDIFDRAVNQNYFRALASEHAKQLSTIYREVFGTDSKITNGCGTCVLKDLKRLGEAFFQMKAELETPTEEFVTGGSTVNNENVVVEEQKPKRGRPRKNE